jgi:hypothetical protein
LWFEENKKSNEALPPASRRCHYRPTTAITPAATFANTNTALNQHHNPLPPPQPTTTN